MKKNCNYDFYKLSYKFAFIPLLSSKNQILRSWWFGNHKYSRLLYISSRALRQSYAEFRKWIFLHDISIRIIDPWQLRVWQLSIQAKSFFRKVIAKTTWLYRIKIPKLLAVVPIRNKFVRELSLTGHVKMTEPNKRNISRNSERDGVKETLWNFLQNHI